MYQAKGVVGIDKYADFDLKMTENEFFDLLEATIKTRRKRNKQNEFKLISKKNEKIEHNSEYMADSTESNSRFQK